MCCSWNSFTKCVFQPSLVHFTQHVWTSLKLEKVGSNKAVLNN